MTYRAKFRPLPGLMSGLAVAGVAFATGCTGSIDQGPGGMAGAGPRAGTGNTTAGNANAGTGNGSTVGQGGGTSQGGTGTNGGAAPNGGMGTTNGGVGTTGGQGTIAGGSGPVACEGQPVINAKRFVRLSFSQISTSIRSIFGATLADQVDTTALIGTKATEPRAFPPLAAGAEGSTIVPQIWQNLDKIAAQTGTYTLANLNAVTACGAAPTDACATMFINTFAQKVFRRPLTAAEKTSLTQLYNEVKGFYTTIPEAIQHAVYGIMQAPWFVYRTELGASKDQAGVLTHYELASSLSYYLTDGPPDQALLDAAAASKLGTKAELLAQATRILGTPVARKNLESALVVYFKVDEVLGSVAVDPLFTNGLKSAAYTESERFIAANLWSGPLAGLLTSKKTQINQALATIYGITTFPPAGVMLDANMFAPVDLPANRAGILTQVAFLAAKSRQEEASVVGRGLQINAALMCAKNPPFPEDQATKDAITAAGVSLANATEREKADYRAKTVPCLGCHTNIDPYGLVLENYDLIGRYQTTDHAGRPVNTALTLPPGAGSLAVTDAVDMATKLASGNAFVSCVAKNMINWALMEGSSLTPGSCAAQGVVAAFNAGDKSFSKLLSEVAASDAFMNRNAGVNP